MTAFNKVKFVLKEAISGVVHNFSKAFIQFLVCFVSLVFFAVVFGIHINVQNASKDMREKIEISVFIKDDATHEEILAIESAIKSNSNVKTYEYISKDAARDRGEDIFEDMPEMLEAIDDLENPFPSSFNVELNNADLTEETAKALMNLPGIENDGIKYGEEYMDKILSLSNGLKYTSYIALTFFFMVSVFFMISIVNVILATKEDESKIMFMIGASPIQIKSPFYIQGALLGLLSSSLAYIAFYFGYKGLVSNFGGILVDISSIGNTLISVMLLTGFITGLIATKIALRTFNRTNKNVTKKRKDKKDSLNK